MARLYRTIIFVGLITGLALTVFPVAAQIQPLSDCKSLGIPCTGSDNVTTLRDYIWGAASVGLTLMGTVAAIFIILGGVKYITARGDQKVLEEAKSMILYAIIGLIVIVLSGALVNFVIKPITESDSSQQPGQQGAYVIPLGNNTYVS